MNILYVGDISVAGSTCLARMKEIEALGHNVWPVDDYPYRNWLGKFGFPFRKLKWGPPVFALNSEILRRAERHLPDCVWIDKGIWVFPETLRRLKEKYSPYIVHYTPDPALIYHQSRHFLACIPLYDLIVTTKSYELGGYAQTGARNVFFQQQGYDARVLKPEKPSELERASFACDVVFVGRWERERQRVAERIGRLGVKLAVWGPFWPRGVGSCGRNAVWRGEYVAGRDYALALSCSKIGLGLLSKLVPDQSTTRTVEIPACGTFLLAERTDEQLALFEEGSEAEYFSSDDECAAKIAFYLSHDDVRTRIAGKGFERCIRSGYSYRDRMSEVLQRIASARRETAK